MSRWTSMINIQSQRHAVTHTELIAVPEPLKWSIEEKLFNCKAILLRKDTVLRDQGWIFWNELVFVASVKRPRHQTDTNGSADNKPGTSRRRKKRALSKSIDWLSDWLI